MVTAVKKKHITEIAEQYRRNNPERLGGVVLILSLIHI